MEKIIIEVDKKFGEEIIIEKTEKGTFFISLIGYMDDMALEINKEHVEKLKNFLNEL